MITFKEQAIKIINAVGVVGQTFALAANGSAISQVATGALTQNTRFAVAHGLGYPPNPWAISWWVVSPDNDSDAPYFLAIDKVDATNITFKPSASVTAANTSILVQIRLDVDDGGRNFAR